MTIPDIIAKVRTIMNEAGEEDSLHLLSDDTLKLTKYIESVIPDAINLILLVSPVRCIKTSTHSTAMSSGDGCSTSLLPADFLKLVALKLRSWKRAVFIAYPIGHEEYKIQHNSVTRSGVNKPTCVFSYNSSGLTIECFPSGDMEYFHYIKSAVGSSNKGLDLIKDELFNSVCYMCASLVYNIFENPNTGEKMKAIAIELIPKE